MSAELTQWLITVLHGMPGNNMAWAVSTDPLINDHLAHVDSRLIAALDEAISAIGDMRATQPADTQALHAYAGLLHLLIAGLQTGGSYRRHIAETLGHIKSLNQ